MWCEAGNVFFCCRKSQASLYFLSYFLPILPLYPFLTSYAPSDILTLKCGNKKPGHAKKPAPPPIRGRRNRLSYKLLIKLIGEIPDEGSVVRFPEHFFDAVVFYEVRKEFEEDGLPRGDLVLGDAQ